VCRQFKISGRVQGVFFRASTRDVAVPLGLTGHAINLPDGRVEVRVCGEDTAIEALRVWLQHGPRRAEVTAVEEEATDCTHPESFTTGW
jgi:acylphosphatase